jgi:hypothetical protein
VTGRNEPAGKVLEALFAVSKVIRLKTLEKNVKSILPGIPPGRALARVVDPAAAQAIPAGITGA